MQSLYLVIRKFGLIVRIMVMFGTMVHIRNIRTKTMILFPCYKGFGEKLQNSDIMDPPLRFLEERMDKHFEREMKVRDLTLHMYKCFTFNTFGFI